MSSLYVHCVLLQRDITPTSGHLCDGFVRLYAVEPHANVEFARFEDGCIDAGPHSLYASISMHNCTV
jgi:hypothetical protein